MKSLCALVFVVAFAASAQDVPVVETGCPVLDANPVRLQAVGGRRYLVLSVANRGPGVVGFRLSDIDDSRSTPESTSLKALLNPSSYLISSRSQGAAHWIPDLTTIPQMWEGRTMEIKGGSSAELVIPADSIVHDSAVAKSQYLVDLRALNALCTVRSKSFAVDDLMGSAGGPGHP